MSKIKQIPSPPRTHHRSKHEHSERDSDDNARTRKNRWRRAVSNGQTHESAGQTSPYLEQIPSPSRQNRRSEHEDSGSDSTDLETRSGKSHAELETRYKTIQHPELMQIPEASADQEQLADPVSMVNRVPSPDDATIRPRVPSHSGFDHGRHSDLHVSSIRSDHCEITPSGTDNHSRWPQIPREEMNKTPPSHHHGAYSLQIPSSGSVSFSTTSDPVLPEDCCSEVARSTKKLSSGYVRSLVSAPTFGQPISSSVPGILGDRVYRYKELDSCQFRLVRILPKTMSLIKCELAHYSLEDPPSYVAISYAWGDTDDRKKIQLEGATIPVAASLHGALFALRAKRESVLVWVDALCIDQQNREERTQQVQLMAYIYSRAIRVAVWLGPEADDSDTAMRILSEIAAHSNPSEHMKSLMMTEIGKSDFASVVALFERDYWNRLWVVQEVFNARDITVYCGSMALSWTVYRHASDIFEQERGLIDFYFPGGFNHGGRRASPTQFTYSQVLVHHGPKSIPDKRFFHGLGEEALLEVMRVCRRKLSADPKDKLYGILGLLAEEVRKEFPADYAISVKEVYVKVFDYLLCTTDRLDVLCETVHFPLQTGSSLPTWVPDWSRNPETSALGRSFAFSAGGSTTAVARVLDDHRRLEMSAIYLDTISVHGIAVGTLCTLADYIMAFIHWRALLLSSGEDSESEARQEEFCRTLSLNQIPPDWKDHPWMPVCYHVFTSLAQERIPRLRLDEELRVYDKDSSFNIDRADRRRFLQEHFGSRMMGRCFCITENGSIGMGSGFMTSGDLVVIPLGCRTPVLLRPEGPRGEFRYVGDVYIHGYMNSDAVKHWQSGERELRKYVLH